MTIDEAIHHCEEVAENNRCQRYDAADYGDVGTASYYQQCADDHEQLAEWLRELKKAKRILKDALIALNDGSCNKDCRKCVHNSDGCDYSCRFKWKHTDEVIKLIGGDDECI